MPAILTEDKAKRWLTAGPMSEEELKHFVEPYPAGEMEARPISTLVNSPVNDRPECIACPDDPMRAEELL